MSWSITVNNLQADWKEVFREDIVAKFLSQHPEHFDDLVVAVDAARELRLASATLAGGRTPTPGSDDEVVLLTITGLAKRTDFIAGMRAVIASGADAEARAEQERATNA